MKLSIPMTQEETKAGWLYLILQLVLLPWFLTALSALLQWPSSPAVLNFLMFAINFGFVLLIFHRFLWQSLKAALSNPIACLRTALFGLVAYYLTDLMLGIVIRDLSPDFSNLNDANIISMTREHYTLMALGTVLLVPITEETLYRGLIFGILQKRSRLAAYLVSVPVFCLIHITGYIGEYEPLQLLLGFLQYVPAGICLAWAYEKSDTIWAPILMHITINQIALSLMR